MLTSSTYSSTDSSEPHAYLDSGYKPLGDINNDDIKEGESEINISPGNDASPNINNQDPESPNSDWPLTDIVEPGPISGFLQ